jgi:hypothetical protein
MRRSFDQVRQIAHTLPRDQRILLANSLLRSVIAGENSADESLIATAWDEEIKQRLDEIDSGSISLIPGDQVRSGMQTQLSPEAQARLCA